MLVLNTNEQGNSGQVLSNKMIRAYPDFKSLLLYPNVNGDTGIQFNSSQLTSDDIIDYAYSPITFNVNGTKVNFSNQILNENLLLVGLLTGGTIGDLNNISGYTGYLYNYTSCPAGKVSKMIRLGFTETLEGGEIIGKRITTSFGRCFDYSSWASLNSQSNLSMKIGVVYRIGLLHLDGSITYGDWIEPPEYLSPEMRNVANDSTTRYFGASNKLVESTTNGLTAVAGDRVIFEFGPRIYWSGLSSNIGGHTFDVFFYFGRKGSPTDVEKDYTQYRQTTNITGGGYLGGNMRGRPIQISIE